MDIVHCIDDNYVPFCAVAIESLCQNNSGTINYHIVSSSLNDANKNQLREIISKKYNHCISFYDVDNSLLKDCVVREGDHVSLATYLRILLPKILSSNIHRVLYLDCDLIVDGDISYLFSVDLDNWAAGAVIDGGTDDMRNYNRLKYHLEKGYFNAGVLLLNLDYWRDNNITEEVFSFIAEYPERLRFWDQDAINSVLAGKIRRLPVKYNMTDSFYMIAPPLRQEYLDEIEQNIHNPTILHFATSNKPWNQGNNHPFKNRFYYYLYMTKWAKVYPKKLTIKQRIKKLIQHYTGISISKNKSISNYRTIDNPI